MGCSGPHLATMSAEEVLPMPGGPLSSTAFLVMSLGFPPPPVLGASTFSPRRCAASLGEHAPQVQGISEGLGHTQVRTIRAHTQHSYHIL